MPASSAPLRNASSSASFASLNGTFIRERFAFGDILTARAVRNSPAHGWGIRYIHRGRLWNVWGLDAVELQLRNGTRFRIGTDEPQALLNALRQAGVNV